VICNGYYEYLNGIRLNLSFAAFREVAISSMSVGQCGRVRVSTGKPSLAIPAVRISMSRRIPFWFSYVISVQGDRERGGGSESGTGRWWCAC
jgi:hypothetical protein